MIILVGDKWKIMWKHLINKYLMLYSRYCLIIIVNSLKVCSFQTNSSVWKRDKPSAFCVWLHWCAEKAMAPRSSTLAWKIPWTEEPGGLQSMGFRRVGHDWASSLSLFTFMHWRRQWQPPPVFLPGESQGRRSLVGCRLWGCTGSDTTEVT